MIPLLRIKLCRNFCRVSCIRLGGLSALRLQGRGLRRDLEVHWQFNLRDTIENQDTPFA